MIIRRLCLPYGSKQGELQIEPLTGRELEVARLILRGYSYTEISEELALSPNTIKSHRLALYSKLGINSRRELFTLDRLGSLPG